MEPIKSVDQYLQQVLKISENIKIAREYKTLWFRGENNSNYEYPLIPKSYRKLVTELSPFNDYTLHSKTIKNIERSIDFHFLKFASSLLKPNKINQKVFRYFLMQHYGISTRLLDWSENALVALYFSVKGNNNENGSVYVLNPFELNKNTINTLREGKENNFNLVFTPYIKKKSKSLFNKNGTIRLNELSRRYFYMDFEKQDKRIPLSNKYNPLAISPPYFDDRINNQSGCFTIFGNNTNGLVDLLNENFLFKIEVDKNSKNEILRQLDILGINEMYIYPGLEGICKTIMTYHELQFLNNDDTLLHALKTMEILTKKEE